MSVRLSVRPLVTTVNFGKTAESVEMSLEPKELCIRWESKRRCNFWGGAEKGIRWQNVTLTYLE